MTRRLLLLVIFVVAIVFWSVVGYRVLAWQTGKLGAVSIVWNGQQVNRYIEWSPNAEKYQFSPNGELQLPVGETAYFLVDPPPRFGLGRVTVTASGRVDLNGEYRPKGIVLGGIGPMRIWTWSDLARFPGGYRLHIQNMTDDVITVESIHITFIP